MKKKNLLQKFHIIKKTDDDSGTSSSKDNDLFNQPAKTAFSETKDDKLFYEIKIDAIPKSDTGGSGYQKEHAVSVLKINFKPEYTVYAATDNSTYAISHSNKEGYYTVSGGWFSKEGQSGYEVKITGCLKKADDRSSKEEIFKGFIASCNMCIKFGNGVITSPVKEIIIRKPIIE